MFNIDKRILYAILALLLITNIIGRLNNTNSILAMILSLPAILIAITFHEFAHALAADKLGDNTPRNQGRLTLNPFAHIDIVGLVLLIVAGFGWGKPVQINPMGFNRKITMSKGEIIVSIAGPLMNFILAIISTVFMVATIKYNLFANLDTKVYSLIITFILQMIFINVGLFVFNLIPLPPLDGSKILKNFLPYNARNWLENNANIFYLVFIIIWITGIAGMIISPAIRGISKALLIAVGHIFRYDMSIIVKLFGL